jgi:hypothetical protein
MKKKLYLIVPLVIIYLLTGCGDKRGGRGIVNIPTIDSTNIKTTDNLLTPVINVYIENSGSMDGYVNGNTEFKGAIRDLLVLLKHYYGQEQIKVNFINTKIRETDTKADLATFATNINTQWSMKGEDRSSSNLNNVFKMILDKTNKETISILFSDCIYSIKGKDAEGLLSDEKSLTKDAFLSKWRQDSLKLATTIVKMKSKFNGIYYDKDDAKTVLNGEERPYYICIIGNNDIMIDFNAKIPLEKGEIEGFDNKYIISTGATENIYYSVLLSTANIGRFKANRKESTDTYVHGIKDVQLSQGGAGCSRRTNNNVNFTFAVAIDLKNVAAEEDYLMNPQNYTLGDNNFRIKEIIPIDKKDVSPGDWLRISEANPTHLIILEATGTATSNVKVSLKKQMPQWIEQTNIIDDKNIKKNLDKTFGIKYLIEGISEAYQIIYPDDKDFFQFEIKINN